MEVKIGRVTIGDDHPCCIIAECCQNHLGSIAFAMEMIRQAQVCGAQIAKFQHFPASDIRRHKRSLTIEEHKRLKEFCDHIGIVYLCTPFSIECAQELNDIGVEGFKIGSGQSQDYPLIEKIQSFGKPIIASFKEIATFNAEIKLMVDDLAFPPFCNGYSCHSSNIYKALAAVALGASVVEKHVIWEKKQICPDQFQSIDFNQLKEMSKAIREIKDAM